MEQHHPNVERRVGEMSREPKDARRVAVQTARVDYGVAYLLSKDAQNLRIATYDHRNKSWVVWIIPIRRIVQCRYLD